MQYQRYSGSGHGKPAAKTRDKQKWVKKRTGPVETVSVFTLKRTDTTLDLSQRAKRAGEERKEKTEKVEEGRYLYFSWGDFWPTILADSFGR